MPQKCRVCHSADRLSIDNRLLRGELVPIIAADSHISLSALYRHQKNHLLAPAAAALRENQESYLTYGNALIQKLDAMEKELEDVAQSMKNAGNIAMFSQLTQQRRETLKLKAQLTHQLATAPQTNITLVSSPAWIQFRDVLVKTLKPYPEVGKILQDNLKEFLPPPEVATSVVEAPGAQANSQ